jgi:hypothetical protein
MDASFKIHRYLFYVLMVVLSFCSCKKFVDIPAPVDQIVSPLPFDNDATAIATVTGIYSEMMRTSSQFSSSAVTLYVGMAADELYYYSPSSRDEFIYNTITEVNHPNLTTWFWQPAYKYIYTANLVIDQLNRSENLTVKVKQMLLGEARLIRAFCYFNLVNLFGDVPLILTPDYRINASLARTSITEVYGQITADLIEAKDLLTENYPTAERVRPNKWTAAALLSRVYLYKGDWLAAENESGSIINSGLYKLEADLNKVFLKSSTEAIWQLKPVNPSMNTWEGNAILPATANSLPTYLVRNELINAFEPADQRKASWLKTRVFQGQTLYYPYKYKVYGNNAPLTEYYTIFRLAEQYLIRAEARLMQNKLDDALKDLNVIRGRAGIPSLSLASSNKLLEATMQERRIELMAEWGHRWFDLKRTGKVNEVLAALKPATWQPTDVLWPIPNNQILLNRSLSQNPGY